MSAKGGSAVMESKPPRQVEWNCSYADVALIRRIVTRAIFIAQRYGVEISARRDLQMDLEAVHGNGCALRLEALLAADDENFAHDVFGIREHLDRETGELRHHFWPRFAVRQ
jgi:hypothetical protein